MNPTNPLSPKLTIVIPCYNEEEVLEQTAHEVKAKLQVLIANKLIDSKSTVYFVDDGSKDSTWSIIETLNDKDPIFKGCKLSRNRGHQNALLAGLFHADGDVLVSIDADLQDDLDAIDAMLDEYRKGSEIVYGVRSERKTDSRFKRLTAESFYRVVKNMGVELVFNHADYRLMSRTAVEHLKSYPEVNLFLRGLIPQLGFSSTSVYYKRNPRMAGESKYPLKKMLSFALDGITSFSDLPLRMITGLGLFVSLASLIMIMWVLFVRIFTDTAIPGWASILVPMFFLGGVQLLSLGVIGQYVSKIFLETKRRPHFIIEKQLD